jgi:hypothetical protein
MTTTNDLSNWTTLALGSPAAYPPATSPPSWASIASRSCARSRLGMTAPASSCMRLT